MCTCEISSLAIFPWSRLLNAACSTNNSGFWRPYNVVAKFSPIFKGPAVVPQRFPNFGKTNNLVSLTAKLSCYARNLWIKFLWEKKYFSLFVFGVRWQDFLLSSDPFSFEGNESPLLLNACDSYPGYGYTGSNLSQVCKLKVALILLCLLTDFLI